MEKSCSICKYFISKKEFSLEDNKEKDFYYCTCFSEKGDLLMEESVFNEAECDCFESNKKK